MNEESATFALSKFRVQKNVKSGKGPLTPAGLLKLVKRFEETGKLEDRARAGRPCLKEERAPCIAVEMEAIASEAASGTSSAREAARRLGLPPSSVRNILRRILQLYPYKLQSCHELLPADTAQREAFAKWAFSKKEQDPTWVFNILWTDEAYFSLHGDVNNRNCRIWVTFNPRPFFFETQCPVNGWITETVNAQRYLTLLWETVVPCLIQRGQISNVTFMQDGATSHTANPVKAFLIQTFGEDRIVSRCCRYPWLLGLQIIIGRLLVVGIFEISRVSIRSIKSVGTERCDPQRSIIHTSGHVALCHSWICHSSGMFSPLWWWSCGTYSGVIKL
ncbi:DUF4817 domain-containing protein [Trichonephila clavipes]|nr:DUF4817 domain-containing protein [Trichonephila clavipes]